MAMLDQIQQGFAMKGRTAVSVLLLALVPQAAGADIIRHRAIPDAYFGTWAPAESCAEADKAAVVLSAKAYVGSAGNCTVDYVSETPGPRGPIYSARMQCSNPASKAKTKSVINLIIRPDNADRISMGATFESLKFYQRCTASESRAKQ
jgi:hypothetical protein